MKRAKFSEVQIDKELEVSSDYQEGPTYVRVARAPFLGSSEMVLQVAAAKTDMGVEAVVFFSVDDPSHPTFEDVGGQHQEGAFDVDSWYDPEEFLNDLDPKAVLRDYVMYGYSGNPDDVFSDAVRNVGASALGIDPENDAAVAALMQVDDWNDLTPDHPAIELILATHRNR